MGRDAFLEILNERRVLILQLVNYGALLANDAGQGGALVNCRPEENK